MSDHIRCPHIKCKSIIDMTDSETIRGHVTYWGQEKITEMDCPHCNQTIYLQEYVNRWWTVGRTPDEAYNG